MRVVLEIIAGGQVGNRVLLAGNRELTVGRSELADFACTSDGKMSRLHFKLETDQVGCYLLDLGSSNGTRVNNELINERVLLGDGDRVVAGQTTFCVHLEGGSVNEARTVLAEKLTEQRRTQSFGPRPSPLKTGGLAVELATTPSGFFALAPLPDGGDTLLAALAAVGSLAPATAVYHSLRADGALVELAAGGEPLFDWMPDEVARERFPIVLPPGAAGDAQALLAAAWGKDALVWVFSLAAPADVLAGLRRAVRSGPDVKGLLGVCWPSVLSSLLQSRDAAEIDALLPDVEAVLVEAGDDKKSWKLFARESIKDQLADLGFDVRQPQDASG